MKDGRRNSVSRKGDDYTIIDPFPERTQAGDLFGAGCRLPRVSGVCFTLIKSVPSEYMHI